jgi:alanine racemase
MEVNLDAIADNVRRIHDICGKRIIAVLKADAYGCGDNHVAKAVLEAGAEMIAVSSLDEAFMLRNEGYEGEILILGATDPEDASRMIEADISPAAYSMEWVRSVIEHKPAGLKVHLKVDTGMNRIGFKDNAEIRQAIHDLTEAGAAVEGIFTHFACADTDPEFTKGQFERFRRAVEEADHSFRWIHCDNSEATLSFKDDLSNA